MRIPDLSKSGPAMILWLLAGVFVHPQVIRGQATCAQEVAQIQAYCKKVDRFINANQDSRRAFENNPSGAAQTPDGWGEVKPEGDRHRQDLGDSLNENAYVWLSQGKIVGANFTLRSESGDWDQFAMYYYREDGTLARISAQLTVRDGEISLIHEQFYDRKGLLIRASTKSCSLKTGREKKPDRRFIPEPLPVYLTTDRLPFYPALARQQ